MKKIKLTYWISTVLLSLMMLTSVYFYLSSAQIKAAFVHLGFPDYFRIELAVAKLAGVIVLLLPAIPTRIKEWAYAGFFITFVSAFIAHVSVGDPASVYSSPLVALALLLASYFSYHRLRSKEVSFQVAQGY